MKLIRRGVRVLKQGFNRALKDERGSSFLSVAAITTGIIVVAVVAAPQLSRVLNATDRSRAQMDTIGGFEFIDRKIMEDGHVCTSTTILTQTITNLINGLQANGDPNIGNTCFFYIARDPARFGLAGDFFQRTDPRSGCNGAPANDADPLCRALFANYWGSLTNPQPPIGRVCVYDIPNDSAYLAPTSACYESIGTGNTSCPPARTLPFACESLTGFQQDSSHTVGMPWNQF